MSKSIGRNHVTNPKTEAIKCQGYGRKGNQILYAEGHEAYRLVHSQDKSQTKRCVECQKMFAKSRVKLGADKRRAANAVKRNVAAVKSAEATLKRCGVEGLGKAQAAYLKKLIVDNS